MTRSLNEIINANTRQVTDLTDGEVKTIASFVITNEKRKPDARYLEVGVLAGTTIRYCKTFTKTTHFVGIDLFEDYHPDPNNTHISDAFRKEDVERVVGDRSTFLKGSSHDILPTLNDQFDFIFIDGNHTYEATKRDFLDCVRLLAPGGAVAFHNASPHGGPDFEQYVTRDGGPWLVCQEIKRDPNWRLLQEIDRLTVFGKV